MTFDDKADKFTLSTGKRFYAHGGDLSPGDYGGVLYGSDGGTDGQFTAEERREIADYMIEQWQDWAKGPERD